MNILALLPLLICIAAAVVTGVVRWEDHRKYCVFAISALTLNFAAAMAAMLMHEQGIELLLCKVGGPLSLWFRVDALGGGIAAVLAFVWLMVGTYGLWYMRGGKNGHVFMCFYFIVGGIIPEICYAGNLFTFYTFFEFMTLISMVLVVYEMTPEAIYAAKKYMFYSFGGAFLTLFGFFLLTERGANLDFVPGGDVSMDPELLFPVFLMIIGFGTKAGIFPMHGWLPTAHPVAPSPASAVLSGVITKMGVLGIIRTVYYLIGADNLRGTWVQTVWILLALTTILLGSVMAYREDILKKRIAYSTVSQVSYVLFGLSLLAPSAFIGAVLHMVFHSIIKSALFLAAGIIIVKTGHIQISQVSGIGRKMPVTMWCYTIVSAALVGIPPTSPFLSKWFIAVGSLGTGIPVIDWIGPVVLLISALFTALYLFSITYRAFFGKPAPAAPIDRATHHDADHPVCDPPLLALVPFVIFTIAAVILGLWPAPLIRSISAVAALVL